MKDLPIEEFVALQKKGILPAGAVIVDVRMDGEYAMSHLPDAINSDVSHPNFMNAIGKLDKTKPYFVYCASGGRSSAAAQMMSAIGFSDVTNLEGGMMAL
jgi:rhodanese-related sulfurtransferase